MKRQYDKKHRLTEEYQVGDKVWLEATHLDLLVPSCSLVDQQLGPFKIKRKVSPLVYELELPEKYQIHPVFHQVLLSRYSEDKICKGEAPPKPAPINIKGELEYEVEKILDGQLWRNQKQYLVKWLGWPDANNT